MAVAEREGRHLRIDTSRLRYFGPSAERDMIAGDVRAAARFTSAARRGQFLEGRALARRLLAAETGLPADMWQFLTEETGRPYACGPVGRGPDISISHSGSFIVAALTNAGRVGIDVERFGRANSYGALANAYLPPDESVAVGVGGEATFLRLWTLREAIGKATGGGLSDALEFGGDLVGLGEQRAAVLCCQGKHWVLGTREFDGHVVSCAIVVERGRPTDLAGALHDALAGLPTLASDAVVA